MSNYCRGVNFDTSDNWDLAKDESVTAISTSLDTDGIVIKDVSAGTQTNDVKVTLDSEQVVTLSKITGVDYTVGQSGIDASTETLQQISYDHHEIHSGSSYVAVDSQNVSTTTMKWQVTTPAGTKYSHMIFDLDCTGEMTVLITEGSDRVDGAAVPAINRNRVGTPNVAGTIITRTPTGGTTDGAVILMNHRSGATGVGSKTIAAGGARGGNEFVLKPNTKYVISVTTYADVWVGLDLDWYEHTDKN